ILSMFFKSDINRICQGVQQNSFIFGDARTDQEKNLVIVYSGGDDVFIVGAWNEIIAFAVDLYNSFTKLGQGKLTFSAGIGMFKHEFPIYQMAHITGILENMAKSNGKDSIALFAPNNEENNAGEHVYKWDRFINNVCNQKISILNKWFYYDDKQVQKDKLYAGTSFIYKLINLYRSMVEDDKINLARIAYTLAGIEPSQQASDIVKSKYRDLKDKLYHWAINEDDRKEFLTALTLIVYLNREEG
ncbi:MAG: type III-A CRISPR-associated protein Cas10/Csm1, partial [Clostridia bacterium]|nr:type III-A CRISPR-associated protein Cas10/Csm1 [Clostridia bacterium]